MPTQANDIEGGEEQGRECPECHSNRIWKAGMRETRSGSKQRFICRNCWQRFSESSTLSSKSSHRCGRQVGASLIGAKNLNPATTEKVAGEEKTQVDTRLIQYEWKCKKRQLSPDTISKRRRYLTRLLKDGADLDNPESVEITLAAHEYPTPTKWLLVHAYRSYCKAFNIQWEPIRIKYQPQMPYIPTEEECKLFIAALPKILGVFCRTLFETGARRGEMAKLE